MARPILILLILISTLLSGLNFPIGKLGLTFSSPFLLLAIRFIAAGLIMVPLIIKRPHPKAGLEWGKIAVIGLLQSVLVLGINYVSMETITSSSASILSSTNPIWTIILGAMFFGMRHRWWQWLGVIIGFLGVFITLGFHVQLQIGALYALLAGMIWGLATILTGRWGKTLDTWVMTAYQMLFGGIMLLIVSFLFEQPHFSMASGALAKNILVLIWLILLGSIANFVTWFTVLRHYDPEKAGSFLFLVPFFGVLFGFLLLHETIQWYVLVGVALIGVGIYLVNRKRVFSIRLKDQKLALTRDIPGEKMSKCNG